MSVEDFEREILEFIERANNFRLLSKEPEREGCREPILSLDSELKLKLGDNTVEQLRILIRKGSITRQHIQTMSDYIGLRYFFNDHQHRLDSLELMDQILLKWFEEELYDLDSTAARQRLIEILTESRCSDYVISEVGRKCFE